MSLTANISEEQLEQSWKFVVQPKLAERTFNVDCYKQNDQELFVDLDQYKHTNVDGNIVDDEMVELLDTKLAAAVMCHHIESKIKSDCWDLTSEDDTNKGVFDNWTMETATKLNLQKKDYQYMKEIPATTNLKSERPPANIGAYKFSDGTVCYYQFFDCDVTILEDENEMIVGLVKTTHKFVTGHVLLVEDIRPKKKVRVQVCLYKNLKKEVIQFIEVVVDVTNRTLLEGEQENTTMERLKLFGLENSQDYPMVSAALHAAKNIHFRDGEYDRFMRVVVKDFCGMSDDANDYKTPEGFLREVNKARSKGIIRSKENMCFLMDLATYVNQGVEINSNPEPIEKGKWRTNQAYKHALTLFLVGGKHYIEGYKIPAKGKKNYKRDNEGNLLCELKESVVDNPKNKHGTHLNSAAGDKTEYCTARHEMEGGREVTEAEMEKQIRIDELAVVMFAIWMRCMVAFDVTTLTCKRSKIVQNVHPDWKQLMDAKLPNYLSRLNKAPKEGEKRGCYTREAAATASKTDKASFGEFWIFFGVVPHVERNLLTVANKNWEGFTEKHFEALLNQKGLWKTHYYFDGDSRSKPTQCEHKIFWKETDDQWVDWNLWVGGPGDRPAEWPPIRPEQPAPVQENPAPEEGAPNAAGGANP